MAVNRITTVLEVDASKAVHGFSRAEAAASKYAGGLDGMDRSFARNRESWDRLGSTMMIGGAAIAGGLGLATKAAIDWETAWAGVTKTTDGTPEQMAALEEELRGLATTLPATHEEIAGVAEAAGQLGIARADLASFTETAIALGETTNLSAEEAATGLAKISNVMGTEAEYGIEGIERMGSALVALGNDGASTEADILAMGQRIAGAGEQIGASEADVLALANALSSVGIEAQLGGGAMSRAMLKMNSAVISGGEELAAFAEVAGMSADEFAAKWREDPVAAVGEFVAGLGRIGASGGDAAAALEDVGLKGTENAQVMLRAAGASDMLTESLALGSEAWDANAALQAEAAKRYETDAAKIQVSINRVKDATIDFGASAAPVVAGAAESVADLASAYGDLPDGVQTFTTGLAAITGGALLLGGATIKAVGFATDLYDALGKVGPAGTGAAGGLTKAQRAGRGLAKWGGYAVGIAAVVTVLNEIEDAATPAPPKIEDVTAALLDLRDAGESIEGLEGVDAFFTGLDDQSKLQRFFMDTSVGVDGLADSYRRLENPTALESTKDFIGTMQGWIGMTSDVEKLEGVYATFGESLAAMPADEAAAQFDVMVEALGGGEDAAKWLLEQMPAYREQLQGAENDARMAGDGADEFADDLTGTEEAAAAAEDAISDLRDQLEMMGGGWRAERAAIRSYQEALQSAQDVAKDGEATYADQEAALDGIAEKAIDVASRQLDMGRSTVEVGADIAAARQDFLNTAEAFGITGEYAEGLADSAGLIPEDVTMAFEAAGVGDAQLELLALDEQIKLLDSEKIVTVKQAGAMDVKGDVLEVDGALVGLPDETTVKVQEIGALPSGERVIKFRGEIYKLEGKDVEVTEHGATEARGRADRLDQKIRNIDDRVIDVTARTHGERALANLQTQIRNMSGRTITVTTKQRTVYETQGVRVAGVSGRGGMTNADGGIAIAGAHGLHRYMADGGTIGSFRGQLPHIRPAGGAGVTWAEDGAGPWEAWISGHPAKLHRSRTLADEVIGRLGGTAIWPTKMADGGTREYARHYVTPTPAPILVQAGAGDGGNSYTTANIAVHGLTLERAMREAHRIERRAALSRRNT